MAKPKKRKSTKGRGQHKKGQAAQKRRAAKNKRPRHKKRGQVKTHCLTCNRQLRAGSHSTLARTVSAHHRKFHGRSAKGPQRSWLRQAAGGKRPFVAGPQYWRKYIREVVASVAPAPALIYQQGLRARLAAKAAGSKLFKSEFKKVKRVLSTRAALTYANRMVAAARGVRVGLARRPAPKKRPSDRRPKSAAPRRPQTAKSAVAKGHRKAAKKAAAKKRPLTGAAKHAHDLKVRRAKSHRKPWTVARPKTKLHGRAKQLWEAKRGKVRAAKSLTGLFRAFANLGGGKKARGGKKAAQPATRSGGLSETMRHGLRHFVDWGRDERRNKAHARLARIRAARHAKRQADLEWSFGGPRVEVTHPVGTPQDVAVRAAWQAHKAEREGTAYSGEAL